MPHGSQSTMSHLPAAHSCAFRIAILAIALLVRFVSVAENADNNTIHFKSPHRYMIVVQVRVNGMGPYSFLLDTGAITTLRAGPTRNLSSQLLRPDLCENAGRRKNMRRR